MIRSERLSLIPLSPEELELLSQGRELMESAVGLRHSPMEVGEDENFMKEFDEVLLEYIIPKVGENAEHYKWFTHWLIVETSSNICIGGIGAAGLPDENGQVMIGYYIDRKFEGLGYATEAVGSFIKWMHENPSVKMVVADTPVNHVASQKVLARNGFVLLGEVEEGLRWNLGRQLTVDN